MNGPTDLSGGTGGGRDEPSEQEAARALRAALGAPQDDARRSPVAATFLAGVERRAARLHRRRQAGALAGAAAAAAVVIAVGGLVLPQLGSMSGGASGSSAAGGSPESAEVTTGDSGAQALQGDGAAGTPDTSSRSETFDDAAAAGAAVLLTAADVTAFSVPVREGGVTDETGQPLPLSACVEGDAGSLQPLSTSRTDLAADPSSLPSGVVEPPGLVERVAQLDSAAAGPEGLARIEAQLPACAGPGLEGTGPTTQLDAAEVTPLGGQALVLASTSGQGAPTLQVLLVHGTVLVQLQVTSDAPDAQTALDGLVDTARTALERATADASTIPARAP